MVRAIDRSASFGSLDKTGFAYFAPIGQIFSTDSAVKILRRTKQDNLLTQNRVIFPDPPGI